MLAVVIGAHGIGGEVRLKVFADDMSAFTTFNDGTLTLKSLRHGSNGAIARFAQVSDRNAADFEFCKQRLDIAQDCFASS